MVGNVMESVTFIISSVLWEQYPLNKPFTPVLTWLLSSVNTICFFKAAMVMAEVSGTAIVRCRSNHIVPTTPLCDLWTGGVLKSGVGV